MPEAFAPCVLGDSRPPQKAVGAVPRGWAHSDDTSLVMSGSADIVVRCKV
jgi:hypothetical protein